MGTQLIGPVFPRVPYEESPVISRLAVLRIDGDPFAAWDDLAGQVQGTGLRMPKSSICDWRARGVHPVTYAPYPGAPVGGSRPDNARAMGCDAVATGPASDGTQVRVGMSLWWWAAGAELHVEVSEGGPVEPPMSYPRFSERPAPPEAVEQLPERDQRASGDVGEPFGLENNCIETGVGRLTVPSGTRLLGSGTTPGLHVDFAAVLAVEDPEAVLRELRDQLDDPSESNDDYRIAEERLADGTPVWRLSGGVSAGGGGCDMWSSPDVSAVIVTTSSD